MTFFQRIKYHIYISVNKIISKKVSTVIGSSAKTKIIRDIFFRPKGLAEIYTKTINYLNFTFTVSCPLQILIRAEKRGIESSLSRLIMNEINAGDNCIDIGANYGFITLIMAKMVGATGHVYSFESDANISQVLRKNIKSNNLDEICSIENYFISRISNDRMKMIDDIFNNNNSRIKLIKIDTDGSDYDCLLGAENLIHRDMPIIIIEMEEKEFKIYQKLHSLGYKYFYDQHYNIVDIDVNPPNLIASFNPLIPY